MDAERLGRDRNGVEMNLELYPRPEIDHLEKYAEFCRYELLTGGPDPHLVAVTAMCKPLPKTEQLWRVLCYVALYNVPSAEAVWREWPSERFLREPEAIEPWLDKHWEGLRTRRERRTVKSPARLARCLRAFPDILAGIDAVAFADFEEVWEFALSLPHIGRYAATKITECWWRLGFTEAMCPDIRADGGWSPRSALQLITGEGDPHNNGKKEVAFAEKQAAGLRRMVLNRWDLDLTPYTQEVMLCEYKASYKTRRQYPGRSLDSELMYELALRPYWGERDTEHMRIRGEISPSWALGEIQGWDEPRKVLGRVLVDYGYTWTDSRFDFLATTDFEHPVERMI